MKLKFPQTFAKKLLPGTDKEAQTLAAPSSEIQLAGFTLLGVYVLSWAIPDTIYYSGMLFIEDQSRLYSRAIFKENLVNLFTTLAGLAIGIYLTFQPSGLVRILNKIRYG